MLIRKIASSCFPIAGTTYGLVRAGMKAGQCSSIVGGIMVAADTIATECVPPLVWVSGKCFVSLGLYCYGACTANPLAIAAGNQVLTSIIIE